jgi:hypothetical protein
MAADAEDPCLARVLTELRAIGKWPARADTRMNVRRDPSDVYMHFCLGSVHKLDVRGPVDSAFNAKYPALHAALKDLMHATDPGFQYDCIQVNKNYRCAKHRDTNNQGPSYIVGLGDYTGGELVLHRDGYSVNLDIHNKPRAFDGLQWHETAPFTGERYSVVCFKLRPRRWAAVATALSAAASPEPPP